jgi:DtxR family Mn-dependent transcriptional regulator
MRALKEEIEELSEEIWALTERGESRLDRVVGGSKLSQAGRVIEEMKRRDLVAVEDGAVTLTPAGRETARNIVRRHRLAEMLFSQVLALSEDVSNFTACEMEHILSEGVTDSVCAFLGHPPLCPHGKPVPPGKCCDVFKLDLEPLVVRMMDLRIGEAGKVVFIKPLTHGRLDRIGTLGLIPGAILRLKQKRPTVVLDIGQTTVAIDREIADEVYVRRAPADEA